MRVIFSIIFGATESKSLGPHYIMNVLLQYKIRVSLWNFICTRWPPPFSGNFDIEHNNTSETYTNSVPHELLDELCNLYRSTSIHTHLLPEKCGYKLDP